VREAQQDFHLDGIGVLELVDDDQGVPFPEIAPGRRRGSEQVARREQEVVEIEEALAPLPPGDGVEVAARFVDQSVKQIDEKGPVLGVGERLEELLILIFAPPFCQLAYCNIK